MYSIEHMLDKSVYEDTCPHKYYRGWVICCADICGGIFSVYRFSFALFCFSLIMMVLTCTKTLFSMKMHCGYWVPKILVIITLVISTLFIDNSTIIVYREISRYMSIPFLFFQIILLIDFSYKCNERCVKLDENVNKIFNFKLCILILSIILYIVCTTTLVITLINSDDDQKIGKNIVFITIFLILFTTGISVSSIAPHSTIFTSAVVSSYTTYLCYSSISSYYDKTSSEDNSISDLVLGLLFTSVSMASMTWTMTESQEALIGKNTLLEGFDKNSEENGEKKSWKYFHFMMAMCSLYMCMHLTNWSSGTSNHKILLNDTSSFWVKICSQWSCFVLYTWTLVAPYLLRNYRDFGVEFS
tara:strand:- start:1763 stop:2836 length:1074 start_codon:yes stop_codon:yes gene_type:complete